jgi:hypothetical protein
MVASFYIPGIPQALTSSGMATGFFPIGLATGGAAFANTALNTASTNWIMTSEFRPNWNTSAIAGGLAFVGGGIHGGMEALKEGKKFWSGSGKSREFLNIQNSSFPTSPDGSLTSNDKTLKNFSEKHFSDFVYRDKANLIYDDEFIKLNSSPGVTAGTDPKMVNGMYNVYFSKKSFSSKWALYMDMGHEYVHVAQLVEDLKVLNYMELGAYSWNYRVSNDNWYLNFAHKKYFNPNASLQNQAIYNRIIKPKYMNYGKWKLWTTRPSF